MRSPEVGAVQVRSPEVGAFEVHSPEVGTFEVRSPEVGAFEVRFLEVGTFEVRLRTAGIPSRSPVGSRALQAPAQIVEIEVGPWRRADDLDAVGRSRRRR